jgi:peptidoglycan/xylan/chitin deacetylase (PgdA/CDA1 family)
MSSRATILMYHSVSEQSDYFWSVTPQNFELQMAELAASGRKVITLAELVRRHTTGEALAGAVVLTFDDGYQDNLSAALPILEQYGFPATVFVTTDQVGSSDTRGLRHLSADEIRKMQKGGLITFAPHSKTHARLTELSDAQVRDELEGSRDALETITDERSTFFAYPYGGHDAHVRSVLASFGFTCALTTAGGTVGQGSDLLQLPRNEINAGTTLTGFRRALTRASDLEGLYRQARKCVGAMKARLLRKSRYYADTHRHHVLARVFLQIAPYPDQVTLLGDEALETLQAEKRAHRDARLIEGRAPANREELVSIGIFGCGRFDLLQQTSASLDSYLKKYGDNFKHEVLFFHDGPNAEIEAWARANPLFDGVFFNKENCGLSYNINRFWFEESRGAYLLNLEDDWICEYADDFITNALGILKSNENVGIVRLERKYPGDYRRWDEAYKIHRRVLSARVFETPTGHAYRICEAQDDAEGIYANSCGLFRFSALLVAGKRRDDATRRRAQEPEYMRVFNRFYEGARGISRKDSPFLHIGQHRSVSNW